MADIHNRIREGYRTEEWVNGCPELLQHAPSLGVYQHYIPYLIPFPSHPGRIPTSVRRKNLDFSSKPKAPHLPGCTGLEKARHAVALPSQSCPPHEQKSLSFRYRLEPFLTNSSEIAQSLAGTFKYYADGAEPQPNWRHLDFLW